MKRGDWQGILKSRGWLAEVEPAFAAAVLRAGQILTFGRGDALYQPGDEPGGMFGVVEGGIVLSSIGRDGLPVAGHIVRPCHWFGYASVFEKRRRKLIPLANEPSRVLRVTLPELERLRATQPSAVAAFGRLAMLGEDMLLTICSDLLIARTERRLAAVLLRVTGAEPTQLGAHPPADAHVDQRAVPNGVALTQGLLAELANASPNTVARFVDRIVQAGWIDWTYRQVSILDLEALIAVAAGKLELP